MKRYFIRISYLGTAYHGWQVQSNAITVQSQIDDALRKVTASESIQTVGCGRTDTGVHASDFFLHTDLELSVENEKLAYQINSVLPNDIAVREVIAVSEKAHARFDAKMREYQYHIHTQKDPFLNDRSLLHMRSLDVDAMNDCASLLLGKKDFSSFARSHADHGTSICDVSFARWERIGTSISFTIRADRYLRNMVRAIVGTFLEAGLGTMSRGKFEEVILAKDRSAAGTSAPAHGLFLSKVEYPYLDR